VSGQLRAGKLPNSKQLTIGVDVGGTNTDAALICGTEVLASVKAQTTGDVSSGITAAVTQLLGSTPHSVDDVAAIMIGTTHFTNAFVQGKGLAKVFALRLGAPATTSIPPFSSWPALARTAVDGGWQIVAGGYQFDGRPIAPLDEMAVAASTKRAKESGVSQIAVAGVFSQLNADQEKRAAEIINDSAPDIEISLSSEVGRVGLLERENAAVMNASLRPLAANVVDAFGVALKQIGVTSPYFISQNDGSLMQASQLRQYPVLTFAAGPTNSLRGAAWLTGVKDALVVDIGGTTTDIGVLVNGFPRQSSMHVDIGGVRTNFRIPDILSIGLGGGSLVERSDAGVRVGPQSVGFKLATEARIFGGGTLTASDIAVASGKAAFGDPCLVKSVDRMLVDDALSEMQRLVETGIDRMKTSAAHVPLVLVGGGSILIGEELDGISNVFKPEFAGVANAIGAAIGQVSGAVDRIYHIADGERQSALDDAAKRAEDMALKAGAAPGTIEIIESEASPLQYLPGGATRVVCRVVGDLALERIRDAA